MTLTNDDIRNSLIETLFTIRSPPLHPLWQFRQLRIPVHDPFSGDLIPDEEIDCLEEGFDVGVFGHCSAAEDDGHDDGV